jgi:hypothetical protein
VLTRLPLDSASRAPFPAHPPPTPPTCAGAILCLLLIYKGGNANSNAGAAAQAAAKNDELTIGLSAGLVALFLLPLTAVYVRCVPKARCCVTALSQRQQVAPAAAAAQRP